MRYFKANTFFLESCCTRLSKLFFLLALSLIFIMVFGLARGGAEAAGDEAVQNEEASEASLSIEDLLIDWDKHEVRPLSQKERDILPYLIYVDMYDEMRGIKPFSPYLTGSRNPSEKNIDFGKIQDRFRDAEHIRELIITKAALDYQAKYGHLSSPAITKAKLPEYEKRANSGDVEAIFELRRYFENPTIEADYNPEQTEARYWLFKAVEAGSPEAIIQAGYDFPYAVTTELRHEGTNITVDVYCEGLISSNLGLKPGCFLYSLSISDTPKQYGHLVIDPDPSSLDSMIPQKLTLLKINNRVVVELVSHSNSSANNVRKDYFDLFDAYLGSNRAEYTRHYFWQYRKALLKAPSEIFSLAQSAQVLAEAEIRTLPYTEALLFREKRCPKKEHLTALDGVLPASYTEKMRPTPFPPDPNVEANRHLYARLSKFFTLDYYDEAIERSWQPQKENAQRIPYTLKFNGLFTPYGIEHKNEVKHGQMYQGCISMGSFPKTGECFALYVKFDFDRIVKRHFVIEQPAVEPPPTYDLKRTYEVNHSILYKTPNKTSGRKYILLASDIHHSPGSDSSSTRTRNDVFDESGRYLGSSNPIFSSYMVLNYKPLPADVEKDLHNLEISPMSLIMDSFEDYRSEPALVDIFVEMWRNRNNIKE